MTPEQRKKMLAACTQAWRGLPDAACQAAWEGDPGDWFRQLAACQPLSEVYSLDMQQRRQLDQLLNEVLAAPELLRHRLLCLLYRRRLLETDLAAAPAWLHDAQQLMASARMIDLYPPPQNYRVSIFMITYNRLNMLKRALQSVLNQSSDQYDLWLYNHGSTDGTDAYCRSVVAEHPQIRYRVIEENQGYRGILSLWDQFCRSAETELVALVADDDWVTPVFVERCTDFFRAHPWIVMCGGGFRSVDAQEQLYKQCGPFYPCDTIVNPKLELQRSAINSAVGVGLIVRKSPLKALAADDPALVNFRQGHAIWEYYYYNRLLTQAEIGIVRETTGMHTVVAGEGYTKISIDRDNTEMFLQLGQMLVTEYAKLFGENGFPRPLAEYFLNYRVLMENAQQPVRGLFEQVQDPDEFSRRFGLKMKIWENYARVRHELLSQRTSTTEPVYFDESNAFGPVAAEKEMPVLQR